MASLKYKAYAILKENIVTCKYAPGEFLNETQLIEEIGTSRTPIREALNKLEQEKLVRIVSKKGIMVSEITLKDINDVYQVRILFEPQIITLWGRNISVEALEHCLKRFSGFHEAMGLDERNEVDDMLHSVILNHCTNAYLTEWMALVSSQNQRIRIMSDQLSVRMLENNEDHVAITKLLLRGDYENAALKMREHLETSKLNTYDCLLDHKAPVIR